jgi:hypothetical protein
MFLINYLYTFISYLFSIVVFFILGRLFLKIINIQHSKNNIKFYECLIFGIFFWGILVFILNFLFKINSFESYLVLSIILILSIPFIYYLKKIDFKILFIVVLLFFFFFQIEFGYDSGLYHLQHQNLIREEKIIFGISNINKYLGHSSIIEYISAPLWFLFPIYLINLQLIFLLVFILYFFERRKEPLILYISVCLLITSSFWIRHIPLKIGHVDLSLGVMFIITFLTSIEILFNKNLDAKNLFTKFTYFSIFTFMIKSSGVIIFFNYISVFIFFLLNKNLRIKDLNFLYFPIFIGLLWLIKSLINTGCLVYPIYWTCFNLEWVTKDYVFEYWNIINFWGKKTYSLLTPHLFSNISYLLILAPILSVFFYSLFLLKKNKVLNNYFVLHFIFIISLFNLIFFYAGNFTHNLVNLSDVIREIVYLLFSIILLFIFLIFSFKTKISFKFYKLFPIFFSIFSIIIWLFSSPIPRLGYQFLIIFFISISCFFYSSSNFLNKINRFFFHFYIIILFAKFFYVNDFKKIIKFEIDKNIPEVIYQSRVDYGVRPEKGDQCWIRVDCSSNTRNFLLYKEIFNYKFFVIN